MYRLTYSRFRTLWGACLLLLFSCLGADSATAQTSCTPFEFKICPKSPASPWNLGSSPTVPGAFQALYEVKLISTNGNFPQTYPFGYLSFSGKISVNGFTSKINSALTDQFSEGLNGGDNPFFEYLNYDPINGEVTWVVGGVNNCEGPEFELLESGQSATDEISLFIIAIDAVPGDVLEWSDLSAEVQTCDDPPCIGDVGISDCGNDSPPFEITMPSPPSCSPNKFLAFSIGTVLDDYFIYVSLDNLSTSQSINELDGVIHIEPDMNGIADLLLLPNPVSGGPGFDFNTRHNADGSWDIYFNLSGSLWTPAASTEQLFAIRISGQANFSQGGDFICTLLSCRVAVGGSSPVVCAPKSSATTLSIPGYSSCGNKLQVSATQTFSANCGLNITFTLTHEYPGGGPLDLSELILKFGFVMENDNNSIGQPSTTLPACTGCSVMSGSAPVLFYDYHYDAAGQGNTPLSLASGAQITIPFTLNQDCIRYYVVYAEAKPVGASTYCALGSVIDLNNWPACDPSVHGSIIIDGGTAAPYYEVTLKSTTDTTYSLIADQGCAEAYSMCPDPTKAPFELVVEPSSGAGSTHCGCGVSTFDMVMISKNVLGIQPLSYPFGFVAGDVTNSMTVNVADITEIRKCLLGIQANFGINSVPAWWYIRESYSFPSINMFNNDFQSENSSPVPSNGQGDYGVFYAVKTGDVNFSCNCTGSRPERSSERISAISILSINRDTIRREGNRVQVPVTLKSSIGLVAIQAGLRFDVSNLRFVQAIPGTATGIGSRHLGTMQAEKGELRFAWSSEDGGETLLTNGAQLFTLEFELAAGREWPRAPWLWVADDILESVVYDAAGDGVEIPLRLEWQEGSGEAGALGLAVTPNPFSGPATVYVYAPRECTALLLLSDANGKVHLRQTLLLKTGENPVPLQAAISPGVYFLSVEGAEQRLIRRIVKL